MPIPTSPQDLVGRLLDAARSEGLETSIAAALELIAFRWRVANTPNRWKSFRKAIVSGTTSWGTEMDSAVGDQISQESKRALVGAFDVLAWDYPQDEDLRVFLHLVFEGLVDVRATRLGRAGLANSSNSTIASLMGALAGSGERLLDPACGFGGTLLAAAAIPRQVIAGLDINRQTAQLAKARFELAGIDASFDFVDWLTTDALWPWDSIIIEPPFSLKLSKEQVNENGPLVQSEPDLVWLDRAVESLSDQGTAVVMLPISSLTRARGANFRKELLDSGRVEAIVVLPAGAALSTSITTCLWILRGSDDLRKRNSTLFVNGQTLFDGGDVASAATTDFIVETVLSWRDRSKLPPGEPWKAAIVPNESLKSGDFSISRALPKPPVFVEPRPPAPGRLISEIRLEGFKAVDDLVSIPLRPLTLVFGRNSAGKSSLIQSLLLVRESLSNPTLNTIGEGFDLGSFRGLVHKHRTTRTMRIGLSFSSSHTIDSPLGVSNPSLMRSVDLIFEGMRSGSAATTQVLIGLGDEAFSLERGLEELNLPFSMNGEELTDLIKLMNAEGFAYPARKVSRGESMRVTSAMCERGITAVTIPANGSVPGAVSVTELNRQSDGVTHAPEDAALGRAAQTIGSVVDELVKLLSQSVYLGPLRRGPERISTRRSNQTGTDLPFFLLDNASERQEVSRWLAQLGMDYDLEVLSLSSLPGAHVLGDVVSLVLKGEEAGVTLSTADVGFGISQVLPILVELSVRRESLILIEQPEIHLHPAVQSDLADLLIESIDEAGRANQIIAETHSEHLMLRVQRRIREKSLDPNQVAVLYVDQDRDGKASVVTLRLDENGDFIDEWPQGFFAERFDEIFSGLL